MTETKRCRTCGRTKEVDDFYRNPGTKDGRASSCKICQDGYHEEWRKNPDNLATTRRRARDHYHKNRSKHHRRVAASQTALKLRAMALLGGRCRCGEDHPAAVQFHHRDPATKLFSISTKTLAMTKKYPWDMIEAEVAKCDLLCANCHAKHHSVLIRVDGEWVVDEERIK